MSYKCSGKSFENVFRRIHNETTFVPKCNLENEDSNLILKSCKSGYQIWTCLLKVFEKLCVYLHVHLCVMCESVFILCVITCVLRIIFIPSSASAAFIIFYAVEYGILKLGHPVIH